MSRLLLWGLLVESARANRAAFPNLPTAWLPHLSFNTLAIWAPELLRASGAQSGAAGDGAHSVTTAFARTAADLILERRGWTATVAPAVLGYVLSHPRFNIYKGRLGALRFSGFGLDAIPHGLTAFTLTLLARDGAVRLHRYLPDDAPGARAATVLAARPALASALVVAVLSAIWEGGEYWMQQEELRRSDGVVEAINMEWDAEDMVFDLVSNAFGWAAATALRRGGESGWD